MDNRFSPKNTTVIICCAGMGTRLGIGTTKALIDIEGKPLIIRLLEQLNQYDDIRIVVGFDYERVIKTVQSYRKDIMFRLFKQCKQYGDYLIVAIQNSDYILKYKPDAKIMYSNEERVEMISALEIVNESLHHSLCE